MSVPHLKIEASGPGSVRIKISITEEPESPFYAVHLNHLGRVRQETVWCTVLGKDQIISPTEHNIDNIECGSIYALHVSVEETFSLKLRIDESKIIKSLYFKYNSENINYVSHDEFLQEIQIMSSRNFSPIYANSENDENQFHFEIAFFLAGVVIDSPSIMEGLTLIPIIPGVSNSSTFDALYHYLQNFYGINIPTGNDIAPYLRYQPLLAINLHDVVAPDKQQAIKFSTDFIHDISTIMAMERGDRPFPLLVLVRERETGICEFLPTNFDIRGNLLPPMFSSINLIQVENLRPIFQRDPYLRLISELFVQSLVERDRSFRIFRQWSLLELIADRQVTATANALKNIDGSEIRLGSGKTLTTERKDGKVYAYLRGGNLPAIFQGTHSGHTRVLEGSAAVRDQGGGLVSLWEAVAASYSIRNEVAHSGRFDDAKAAKNDRDNLCKEFFSGTFGFLDHALNYAIWQEIAHSAESRKS